MDAHSHINCRSKNKKRKERKNKYIKKIHKKNTTLPQEKKRENVLINHSALTPSCTHLPVVSHSCENRCVCVCVGGARYTQSIPSARTCKWICCVLLPRVLPLLPSHAHTVTHSFCCSLAFLQNPCKNKNGQQGKTERNRENSSCFTRKTTVFTVCTRRKKTTFSLSESGPTTYVGWRY